MSSQTVEMESRDCVYCGRKFKVMVGSRQARCSWQCENEWEKLGVKAEPKKASKGEGRKIESVSVDCTPKAKSSEKRSLPVAGGFTQKRLTAKESAPEIIGSVTSQPEPPKEESGGGRMLSEPEIMQDVITPTTRTTALSASVSVETKETPAELSDASCERLVRGGLDSMTLLNKSANKLMSLIDECVSEDDLQRGRDGDKRVESHRIQQAIEGANALAHTIQTQANLFKAMSTLVGKK